MEKDVSVVEIGNKGYIIAADGRGEVVRPAHLGEQLSAHVAKADDQIPGQVPAYATKGQVQSAYAYCANYPCQRFPAEGRVYCSNLCMNRANAKRRYRREKGHERWLDIVDGAVVHFSRPFPTSLRNAKYLFTEHISTDICQFRSENNICPGVANTYSDPGLPRCLIYATLADDLISWQARNSGRPSRRRYTTEDGRWLEEAYGRSTLRTDDTTSGEPGRPLVTHSSSS